MFGISKRNLFIIAMVSVSSTAFSKEMSYNFIEGTYSSINIADSEFSNINADGISVSGVFSVSSNLAINVSYESTSFDTLFGVEVDATALSIGIIAHTAIAPETDVFGRYSILNSEITATDGFTTISGEDNGNIIGIGLRHMLDENVELEIGASRANIFNDTSNSFGMGARFYANDTFSVGVGYSSGEGTESFLLNARLDIK